MAQNSRGLQNDKATNAESEWLPTYAAIICASNERARLVDLANHYVSVLVTNWPAGFDTQAVRQLLGQDGSHFLDGYPRRHRLRGAVRRSMFAYHYADSRRILMPR
jgi:hypothetical protein